MNKQDIINTQFDSKEEIIETLYLYSRRNSIDDDLYQKVLDNNPRFNLSLNQLLKAMLDYDDAFYRKVENFARRIEKDRFVRDEGKKLSKFLKNAISQSKAQGTVARTLSMMLGEVSKIIYESCFTQENLENLIDLVDDEQHLKIEFEDIIMRLIKNVKDFTYGDANFELVSFRTVAEYYVAYYIEDNPSRVKELKQKIKDYIVMSDSDLKKIVDKEIEEAERSQSSELDEDDNHLDRLWSEAMTSLQNNPINDNLSTLDNFNNEKYDELLKDDEWTPETKKEADNIFKKSMNIYPKYFLDKGEELDKDVFFDVILFKTVNIYFYRKDAKQDTFSLFRVYLTDCFNQFVEKRMDGETPENNLYKYMILTDFFMYLAHSLVIKEDSFADELTDLCFQYLSKNEQVSQNYSQFMNDYSDEEHCLSFSPSQMYDTVVIMSVLFEMDSDKSIQRAIRRLLLKYYKNINESLEQYNLRQRKIYLGDDVDSHMSYQEIIHEYAVTFLFNYFKEPVYVAPFSAFIRDFEDVLSLNMNFYNTSPEIVENIGTNIENDNASFQRANEYYQLIDSILKEAKETDLSDLENEYSQKYTILHITAIQKAYTFDSFLDYEYMIKKNQKALAMYLLFVDNEIAYGFDKWDIEEQIDLLWEASIIIVLTKEVYKSFIFLPKVQDLANDKYTYLLEKKIEEKDELINEKDTAISSLKNQIKALNDSSHQEINETIKEINKVNYKEIEKLNKKLKEKDKKIKELEENQKELYKLRELLFELQNSEDVLEETDAESYEDKLLDISNKNKIVCIGGHIRLLSTLKEKYPHMSFMEVANSVSDRVIRNADYVFFFYNFMSHSTYNKVMSLLSNNEHIKWDYISAKNIDIVEKEMYEKITRFKN